MRRHHAYRDTLLNKPPPVAVPCTVECGDLRSAPGTVAASPFQPGVTVHPGSTPPRFTSLIATPNGVTRPDYVPDFFDRLK